MALLGAALIGAGGTLGAAAMGGAGDPQPSESVFGPFGGPEGDPLTGAAALELMTQFGVTDPSILRTIVQESSPLSQAWNNLSPQLPIDEFGSFAKAVAGLQKNIDRIVAGEELSEQELFKGTNLNILRNLAGAAGLSVNEMVQTEIDFRRTIPDQIAALQEAAGGLGQARRDIMARQSAAMLDFPRAGAEDIAALRELEQERFLRNLDKTLGEQREDLLRSANVAGFNPGRPLGDIEEFRARAVQDADLQSLQNALALLSGQQTLAANELGQARNFLDPLQAQALGLGGLRAKQPTGAIQTPLARAQPSALPGAIAASGQMFASALMNRGKPTVDDFIGGGIVGLGGGG